MGKTTGLLLAATLFSGGAHAVDAPMTKPHWDLLELDYGINFGYSGPISETRDKSVYGGRAHASFSLAQNLFISGSYDVQRYDTSFIDPFFGPIRERVDVRTSKLGSGTCFALGEVVAGLLQVSWQDHRNRGHVESTDDNGNPASDDGVYSTRGLGYLAGIRTMVASRTEIAISYELAPLKGNVIGIDLKERYATAAVMVAAPLTRATDFTLRFEEVTLDLSAPGYRSTRSHNENILLGLRFAL